MEKVKYRLKRIDWIKENYRRIRKVFLHFIHGRFYQGLKLLNHYNPIYRLIIKTPLYDGRKKRKNLKKVLSSIYGTELNNPNTDKPKIAIVIREGDSFPRSSAFIRLISPLTSGAVEQHYSVQIFSENNYENINNAEVIIVQRTALNKTQDAHKLVEISKQLNSILIWDNDDAFHMIPENHPEYNRTKKRIDAVSVIEQNCDEIWVSEVNLIPAEYKNKSKVIRNSLDDRLWNFSSREYRKRGGALKIIYMGTATHDEDFQIVLPALMNLQKKYPGKFELYIIGVTENLPDEDWIIRLLTPRFGSLYPSFVHWFIKQGPFDIGISPLIDNEFNNSKSDIKCLDYLASKIFPYVSDARPYQNSDLDNFIRRIKDDDWEKELEQSIKDINKFREKSSKLTKKASYYLQKKRSHSDISQVQLNRIKDLLSK